MKASPVFVRLVVAFASVVVLVAVVRRAEL